MFNRTLREWRDRRFCILLFLSLVVLFCVYRITLPSPLFINLGTEGDERYLRDFYSREQGGFYSFRWTKGSSYVKLPNLGSLPLEIILGGDAARPEEQPLPRVSLIANGTVLADFTMQNGIRAYQFFYDPPTFSLPRDLLLEVKSDTFAPPDGDYRALGILLNTVEIKPIVLSLRLLQVSLMPSLLGALSIAFGYLLLRWLGVSQKTSLVCGMVVLVLFGLGVVRRFIVARFLVGFFGLLLMGYVLAILLEARGYREPLITRLRLGRKTLENSIKAQVLSPHSQSSGIPGVLPAYLPAVVLFVLMPFALYLPNQSIFDNNLTLVIPYLVLAVIYFFIFLVPLSFVGQPLRTGIVILLFYIGLYLCLSDIISPVQLEELMGGRETPQEPLFLSLVEVVMAVIVIFGMIKLPWKWVKHFGSIFVLLLLVSEAIVVFNGLSPETRLPFIKSTINMSNPPKNLACGGNIYHITFDGYTSTNLFDSLEVMRLTKEFDGFTFFERNRANYVYTRASVPSYMTGSFYKENQSLKEWRDQLKSSGIISNLYDAGYKVSIYAPGIWWVNQKASDVKMYQDVLRQYKSLSLFHHFADLWLLRVVPNYLQQEVYREGKGIFTRLFVRDKLAALDAKPFLSAELMRQLIDDEAERPDHGQYVYAHLDIPHPPYVMNRDCVFSPSDSHYDEQTLCATRLMAELVSELKELGRYHESTIIFQSDHGIESNQDSGNASFCKISLDNEKEIDESVLKGYSAREINIRTCALLLIKPPVQSGKPLAVSDRPTQLVDIPATIYDLLDLSVRVKEGESAFAPELPDTREIHIFLGLYRQRDEKGKKRYFGRDLFEGEANHFSLTNGKGWKVYPNIHVRWE
jgi:hypothetical protein